MIVCAGKIESFSFATSIGIGLIETSINLSKICLEQKPESLLFIGTAGSYGTYNIGDLIESTSSCNIELSYLNNDSYTPICLELSIPNKNFRNDTRVNCSNYISTNEHICKEFLDKGIGIENMEFYSVLQVAKEFDIPVAGIFIVTNYTNKNAHQDFIKNHKTSMEKLTKYLQDKELI